MGWLWTCATRYAHTHSITVAYSSSSFVRILFCTIDVNWLTKRTGSYLLVGSDEDAEAVARLPLFSGSLSGEQRSRNYYRTGSSSSFPRWLTPRRYTSIDPAANPRQQRLEAHLFLPVRILASYFSTLVSTGLTSPVSGALICASCLWRCSTACGPTASASYPMPAVCPLSFVTLSLSFLVLKTAVSDTRLAHFHSTLSCVC